MAKGESFSPFADISMPVFLLSDSIHFPPPHLATRQGLIAIGGDLSPERLLAAYRRGIFPWYSETDPILWWSPDPRMVLYPQEIRISRSLKKALRQCRFQITMDTCFAAVIQTCAQPRKSGPGTWIGADMVNAYIRLHEMGYAHSVEMWHSGRLAGGLYGVALGGCFFGESMFSSVSNASKAALAYLCSFLITHGFDLIDCQVVSTHLESLGARHIPRAQFLKQLKKTLLKPTLKGRWSGLGATVVSTV
jgi:leucyl/phenylalanyl-tRNA---protein transferase